MEVTCDHCKKTLRIPDEKVPQNQVVQIACPACRNKIIIDTRMPEASTAGGSDEAGAEQPDYGDDTSLGFYEEGTRLALVLDSDEARKEIVHAAVEDHGFRFVTTPGTRDAIGKMRFHVFDLIVLADGFDGQPLEYSPIINSLNHSPMPVRRKIFLTLVGDQFQTMDNMMAFAMSANLVVHSSDVEKLSAVLKKALAENERFYKVFTDVIKETGKA